VILFSRESIRCGFVHSVLWNCTPTVSKRKSCIYFAQEFRMVNSEKWPERGILRFFGQRSRRGDFFPDCDVKRLNSNGPITTTAHEPIWSPQVNPPCRTRSHDAAGELPRKASRNPPQPHLIPAVHSHPPAKLNGQRSLAWSKAKINKAEVETDTSTCTVPKQPPPSFSLSPFPVQRTRRIESKLHHTGRNFPRRRRDHRRRD
jgi:hypothetical protein